MRDTRFHVYPTMSIERGNILSLYGVNGGGLRGTWVSSLSLAMENDFVLEINLVVTYC